MLGLLKDAMAFKKILSILRETYSNWNDHDAPRMGAALAFYTILSLAPLVIGALAIVALIFDRSAAQQQLLAQVEYMVGPQGADAIKGMIEQAQKPAVGGFASLIGATTLLVGASGVFGELQSALNRIWEANVESRGGFWGLVKQRFFSFGMVLAVGFLLLVSLLLSATLAALGAFFGGVLPMPEVALSAINLFISWASTVALFALIFRYVPKSTTSSKNLWIGAATTGSLFTIGKFLIGLYLGKSAVGSAYGAAGSLVVVIVWVYYSAMIFLFGAEFTHVLDSKVDGRETVR